MSNSPLNSRSEADSSSAAAFEKLYIQLRKKEQRFYTDDEVRSLPQITASHAHYKEWLLRSRSCKWLIRYLGKKRKSLHILEVGCGNGWLSAQLAKNISGQVVGMDINKEELAQAERVFSAISNLKFIQGDIRSAPLGQDSFDIIIFAASLQYFSSLDEIIRSAFQYLKADGEIHIIDTLFYRASHVAAARQRTKDYYNSLGFPEAADYYFHHCLEDLDHFSAKILYNTASWVHRFTKNKSPFFQVCIKKGGKAQSNP
jgi:ubiquinone/menaquinone biosynthesis C-methylase UbiE